VAWDAWYSLVEEKHRAEQMTDANREREERLAAMEAEVAALERQRLEGAVKKMLNAKVAAAWESWMELHECVAGMKRIMRRMLNRCVAATFDRWCDMAEEARDMRQKMNKARAAGRPPGTGPPDAASPRTGPPRLRTLQPS
jgi:hypothetical protein